MILHQSLFNKRGYFSTWYIIVFILDIASQTSTQQNTDRFERRILSLLASLVL